MVGWWFGPGYLLGQVNFGVDAAAILGILLAAGGGGFFALRSLRPELSREQDIVIAAISLLCGLILIFKGWELNQIHEFNQFLLTGVAVALAVETIRLRAATVEQAKRRTPTVDRKRRTSRVYRAELDEIEPYGYEEEEVPRENRRRLKGTAVARPNRGDYFEDSDDYEEDEDYRERSPREERPMERSQRQPRRPLTRTDSVRGDYRRPVSRRQDTDRRDAWDDDAGDDDTRGRYRDDRDDSRRDRYRDDRDFERERPRPRRESYREDPEIDFGREERDWREPPTDRREDDARDRDSWQERDRPASRDREVPPPQEERPPIPRVARQPKRSRPAETADDSPATPPANRSTGAAYTSYEPLDEDYDLGDSEY